MKKAIVTAAVLAVIVAALVFFLRKVPHRPRAAELAPAETILFAQLPDVWRSALRWKETALCQLWSEPEMQAFLEKPLLQAPYLADLAARYERIERTALREAFVAVTALDGATVKGVAGICFAGRSADAEALMADARGFLQWPAHAKRGGWAFIASDAALLQAVLERCEEKSGASLAGNDVFQASCAPLPADGDALLFALPEALPAAQGKWFATVRALAAGTRCEGAVLRDTVFFLGPGPAEAPLARNSMALSARDTLLYYATTLPDRPAAPAWLPTDFAAQWPAFARAFGPECGALVDWPAEEESPTLLLALEVRNQAHAKALLDALAGTVWGRTEKDGVTYYQAPAQAMPLLAPTAALTARQLLLGFSRGAVESGLARLDAGAGVQALGRQAGEPTDAYGYLDLKTLFERAYGTLRPFLAMSLAFSETGKFIDVGKLPSAETVSRHLGPTLHTQRARAGGTLMESVGPITFHQAALAAMAAAGTAASSSGMEALSKAGGQSGLLQQLGLPAAAPSSAPPAER